jgi:hypothetical protein
LFGVVAEINEQSLMYALQPLWWENDAENIEQCWEEISRKFTANGFYYIFA